jgi:hypothetical protein
LACHLQIDADPDPGPDPAYHFDANPDADQDFYFDADADPDPGFKNDADPCESGSTTLGEGIDRSINTFNARCRIPRQSG